MRVYYLKNSFLFYTHDDGFLPSEVRHAQDFLQHQPSSALQYIRIVELDITDYAGARFEDAFLDSYSDFVRFITSHMRIQHLTLHIHVSGRTKVYADFSGWKHLVELCKAPKFQRLRIKFDFELVPCESYVESSCFDAANMCGMAAGILRGVKIIENLRSNMLDNEAEMGRKMLRAWTVSVPDSFSQNTALLFEADNNSQGECLLPALDDVGDTNPGGVAPFICEANTLDILNEYDEQQYGQLQEAANKFGHEYFGHNFDEEVEEAEFEDEENYFQVIDSDDEEDMGLLTELWPSFDSDETDEAAEEWS